MRQTLIEAIAEDESTIESLTPFALQRDWKTPGEFPMCPEEISESRLNDYASRLESGVVSLGNSYGEAIVVVADFSKDGSCLSVLCKIDCGVKNHALSKVFFEEGIFIQLAGVAFFLVKVRKRHITKLSGWHGRYPECIDDYC